MSSTTAIVATDTVRVYDARVAARQRPPELREDRLARNAHVNVIVAANRFSEGMERICRQEGLSQAQYVALWVLCLADDPATGLPIGALADGLLNRASDTTRLVDRLEKTGLAERLRNPTDRRGVLVRATPTGQDVFARLAPKLREYHRAEWANLSAAELETLNTLLARALWDAAAGDRPTILAAADT
jgi:DNA-binding MarR family transcriptional regulator